LEINGNYIKFTAIGIYIDAGVVPHLAPKITGKSVDELCEEEYIFEELLSGWFYSFYEPLISVII
jgi:chalcone isomerase